MFQYNNSSSCKRGAKINSKLILQKKLVLTLAFHLSSASSVKNTKENTLCDASSAIFLFLISKQKSSFNYFAAFKNWRKFSRQLKYLHYLESLFLLVCLFLSFCLCLSHDHLDLAPYH